MTCRAPRETKTYTLAADDPKQLDAVAHRVHSGGSTAEPGLIYYFNTPRRLSTVVKWIMCYMALSRVRSLSTLRSVGLTSYARELIDLGPPDGFLTRFPKVFGDKISSTQKEVEDVLAELGWND